MLWRWTFPFGAWPYFQRAFLLLVRQTKKTLKTPTAGSWGFSSSLWKPGNSYSAMDDYIYITYHPLREPETTIDPCYLLRDWDHWPSHLRFVLPDGIQGSPRLTWDVLIPGKIYPRCGPFFASHDLCNWWKIMVSSVIVTCHQIFF